MENSTNHIFSKTKYIPKYPKAYGPICLAPKIGTIYEHILKKYLHMYIINTNNTFNNNVYCFRMGWSIAKLNYINKQNIKHFQQDYKYFSLLTYNIEVGFNSHFKLLREEIIKLNTEDYIKINLL